MFHFFREKLWGWSTDLELAKLLCQSVSPGQVSDNGNSVLHELSLKCRKGYQKTTSVEDLMEIMLRKGADPNQRNRNGETPLLLMFTEKRNKVQVVMKAMSTLLSHGADPMLCDLSGKCPFYEAARKLPTEGLTTLLKADLNCRETARLSRERFNETNERLWWADWELALKKESWTEAKSLLCSSRGSLPADIDKTIRLIAFTILAEKHLEMAKNMFQTETTIVEKRRSYVAAIPRDCRAQNVQLDLAYFDYLLELCQ